MMQSPQILHQLAKQSDRFAPPRHAIERELPASSPARRPVNAEAPRANWFWQLLFGRRGTAAS